MTASSSSMASASVLSRSASSANPANPFDRVPARCGRSRRITRTLTPVHTCDKWHTAAERKET